MSQKSRYLKLKQNLTNHEFHLSVMNTSATERSVRQHR